jgi:hypothetical protein
MKTEFLNTYKLLQRYEPLDPEEVVSKKRMLELLTICDDCFFKKLQSWAFYVFRFPFK